jgi:hypothetical protein
MTRSTLGCWAALLATALCAGRALAHGDHGHKNLKVLADDHHAIDAGMKRFARGLGVECTACHIKGKWDLDERPTKEVARTFFKTAVGEADAAKRESALAPLLEALKLPTPKQPAELWAAVGMFKKQDAASDAAGKP